MWFLGLPWNEVEVGLYNQLVCIIDPKESLYVKANLLYRNFFSNLLKEIIQLA
jgi:hypothetical protein